MKEKGFAVATPNTRFSVAIDGPAGSGKSTIAKEIALKFGLLHIDSGAFYRTVAYFIKKNNIDYQSEKEFLSNCGDIHIELIEEEIFLNGLAVAEEIRTREISDFTSLVSQKRWIRDFVTKMIRAFAVDKKIIMDGRDICTVVLPEADIKIFLTASLEVRAERRKKELEEKGKKVELQEILKEIKQRDFQDATRLYAPLKPAEDSYVIDSSELLFENVIDEISKTLIKRFPDYDKLILRKKEKNSFQYNNCN